MNEDVEIKYRLRGETALFAAASERRPLSNSTPQNGLKSFGRPPRFHGRPTSTPGRSFTRTDLRIDSPVIPVGYRLMNSETQALKFFYALLNFFLYS